MSDQAENTALITVDVNDTISDEEVLQGRQIWHRMRGESVEHYRYFKVYCHMTQYPHPDKEKAHPLVRFRKRSIQRVYRTLRLAPVMVADLAKKYKWDERAKAYDAYMAAHEQQVIEAAQAIEVTKWSERKATLREQEWEAAQTLIARAKQMLEMPLLREELERVEEELDETGKIVIKKYFALVPNDWTLNDISRFLELASKIARLSIGMETAHAKLDMDFSNLPDDELEKIAKGGK